MTINATGGNAPYDLTNITGTGNLLEFVQNVNELTGHTFMLGMLLAGFIILYTSMRSEGNDDALVAASFITAVLSISFFALGFIKPAMLTFIILIFVGLFVFKLYKKD